ncbi:hypothetical protein PsorP6_011420 [Peronosclerospora sorghi]|uniref:Uncharacterized protein n=1 Tax=Peronosclerospora sorghi TaxID=230839 RepID=A0ACC0WM49_9STRA|nr:hypothetical protein PsorP6_011420 [Peronosclerospora sorghi]
MNFSFDVGGAVTSGKRLTSTVKNKCAFSKLSFFLGSGLIHVSVGPLVRFHSVARFALSGVRNIATPPVGDLWTSDAFDRWLASIPILCKTQFKKCNDFVNTKGKYYFPAWTTWVLKKPGMKQ